MLNIFLDAIIIFLLLYALFSISAKIAKLTTRKSVCKDVHAVIKPKDADDLEYTIRCAAVRCSHAGLTLIIIDSGLCENAKYIVSALENEFSNLSLLAPEEYIEKYL